MRVPLQLQRGARLFIDGVSLRKIAGVDHRKLLPLHDTSAELDLELDDAAGHRRQHFHGAGGVRLHDRRQHQRMGDLLYQWLFEGEPRAQRRAVRHHDAISDPGERSLNARSAWLRPRGKLRPGLGSDEPVSRNAKTQPDQNQQEAAARSRGWGLWRWDVTRNCRRNIFVHVITGPMRCLSLAAKMMCENTGNIAS